MAEGDAADRATRLRLPGTAPRLADLRDPGTRSREPRKGPDLVDGSEIKAASALGGIDQPRWNHSSFGTAKNVDAYLKSKFIYFILFDTTARYEEFQLQPPRWQEGSRVTNLGGNLELPLIFEAVQREIEGVDFMDIVTWKLGTAKSKAVA